MRKTLSLVVATTLLLGSTVAQAEVRPEQTTFAIAVDDDEVGIEPPGWLWGGIGILAALGILVFASGSSDATNGQPNSPR